MPVVKNKYSTVYYNEKDELHREDGPAIENVNGDRYYFIKGFLYSKKEYDRLIKLKGLWE